MDLSSSWEASSCAGFYGIQRFITVFTRALHCPDPESDQPSHTTRTYLPLRSILVWYSHLDVFLVVSFLLAFPPESCVHYSSSHAFCVPRPSNPPWSGYSNYTLSVYFNNSLINYFAVKTEANYLHIPKNYILDRGKIIIFYSSSSSSLSCDRSIASSKLSSPKSAILSLFLQLPVSSCFLNFIQYLLTITSVLERDCPGKVLMC
jgi:hypothetical protein